MKKYIALMLALGFFAVLPSAIADEGKLAVDAPAQIRLPHNHNDNHNIILTLRVNNIQVKEDWRVTSSSPLNLQISNGVLSIDEPLTVTQIVATVIVQDLFSDLNQAYKNLSVQAVISIEIVYDVVLADAPPLRALVGQTVILHTFAATGEPTTYNIVAGNQTYFSLDNNGDLSLLAGIAVGFYTLTVGVSDNRSNSDQAVATVQIFPALSISEGFYLNILVSDKAVSLHTFTASGGVGDKTYTVIVDPVHSSYFSVGVTSGVLSAAANVPAGLYALNVQAADKDNNVIQAAAVVDISPFVSLPAPSTLYALEGTAATLHTFVGVGGLGAKSYALVSGNVANYFTLSDGVLVVSGDAVVGEYPLEIEVSDSAANKATITVMVEVSSQGQFFVLSGFNPRYVELVNEILSLPTDGVWSSADGNAWVGENDASWSGRGAYQAIVHNGIIYVLGGNASDSGSHQSDVWSSADGKAWAEETANAWPSRGYHQAVSHQGKMYVLGGLGSGTTRYSDVWSSADGETWIEEMASVGWEARYAHQVVSYNGRMYLLGGRGSTTTKNDVWSSTDGKTWSLETNNADWTGRYFHMAVVHQGKMYVLGGYDDSNRLHDVWSSADGKTWVEEKANAGWVARSRFAALSFSNTLYVLGGDAGEPNFYDDIWSSADGKAWGQIGALPLTLWGHEAIIFPPPLALFGVGEVLSLTAGVAKSELHTFMSEYGKGEYSYEMSPAEVGFAVSDNGVLSADASIAAGDYTLTVWVSDGVGDRAQTAVKVQVLAGAFSSASLSRWGVAESMMKRESGFYQKQAMGSVETAACKSNRRWQFIVESATNSHPPHWWGGCEVALANSRGV